MRTVELVLPATSANLGPAFDAAALALALQLKVRARLAKDFSLTAEGRDRAICTDPRGHLVLTTYADVLARQQRDIPPLAIEFQNAIPIGKGCGSSAAARLAGILLAVHFGELRWTGDQILGEACAREGHPDNAAACWMGGLVVARQSETAQSADQDRRTQPTAGAPAIEAVRFVPAVRWPLLLAVPSGALSTEHARSVLPAQYSRADAVANLQNALILISALIQGRGELLRVATDDRLHQPYRAALCPLFPALRGLSAEDGVLSVMLSGAGPSVLMIVDPSAEMAVVRDRVAAQLRRMHLEAELLETNIENRGARDCIQQG
jgi:homoserine kinase